MISEIHTGSGTHLSGGLRPGDIILTVDFIDVTDFTHDEAANLLKSLVRFEITFVCIIYKQIFDYRRKQLLIYSYL